MVKNIPTYAYYFFYNYQQGAGEIVVDDDKECIAKFQVLVSDAEKFHELVSFVGDNAFLVLSNESGLITNCYIERTQ